MKAGPTAVVVLAAASCLSASFADVAFAADAAAPTVILLRLPNSDAVTSEAMARVSGELVAAGFGVAVVPVDGADARRDLEAAGRERKPVAAFAILVRPLEGGTSVAEIWVSDRIRQKVVIQNAVLHETDRGRESEILAVRAVEVLKANLADLWAPRTEERPVPAALAQLPAPTMVVTPVARGGSMRRAPFASGLGLGLGVGMVESFGAAGATWAPEATASYGWEDGLSVRATLAGFGPAIGFSAAGGSASVDRELALLEALKTWWPRSAVVPFAAAGCGAQHARVVGVGDPPYQGHTSSDWSLAAEAGIGVAVPLLSTLSIVVQGRGLAAWPPTVVRIAGADVGRLGAASLLADAELFGTLP